MLRLLDVLRSSLLSRKAVTALAAAAAFPACAQIVEGTPAPAFSAVTATVRVGVEGVGFDLATPVAPHVALRTGASFASVNLSAISDHVHYTGNLYLRNAQVSADLYPWAASSFRLSPGFAFINRNHIFGTAAVAGGQSFTLNNSSYQSSPSDPVHGSILVEMGHEAAPRVTAGFASLLPRHSHWTVPLELGFLYVDAPRVTLNLQGTVCNGVFCRNMGADPTVQQNVAAEAAALSHDLRNLRFYPVLSLGVGYSFGRTR